MKKSDVAFVCGNCKNNEDGLCDILGWFVDDDDAPLCAHGKDWEAEDYIHAVQTEVD